MKDKFNRRANRLERNVLYGTNASGEVLPPGTPVYIESNPRGIMRFGKAEALDPNKMPSIGVTTKTMKIGEEAEIVIGGFAEVSIPGITGVSVGDSLYVGATGGVSLTPASGGNPQIISSVLSVSAPGVVSSFIVSYGGSGSSSGGSTLEGLSDTPSGYGDAGQVLISDGVSGFYYGEGGLWDSVAGTSTNITYEDGVVGIKDSAVTYPTSGPLFDKINDYPAISGQGSLSADVGLHVHQKSILVTSNDPSSRVPVLRGENSFSTTLTNFEIGMVGNGMYMKSNKYRLYSVDHSDYFLEYKSPTSNYQSTDPITIGQAEPSNVSGTLGGIYLPGGLGKQNYAIRMGGPIQFYNASYTFPWDAMTYDGLALDGGVAIGARQSGSFAYFKSSDQNTAASYGYLGINVNNPTVSGPALEVSSGAGRFNNGLHVGDVTTTGYAFPTADGTANQYLQTDGNGALSFATISATLEGLTDTPTGYGTNGQILVSNGTDAFTLESVGLWDTVTYTGQTAIKYENGVVGIKASGTAYSTNSNLLAKAGQFPINTGLYSTASSGVDALMHLHEGRIIYTTDNSTTGATAISLLGTTHATTDFGSIGLYNRKLWLYGGEGVYLGAGSRSVFATSSSNTNILTIGNQNWDTRGGIQLDGDTGPATNYMKIVMGGQIIFHGHTQSKYVAISRRGNYSTNGGVQMGAAASGLFANFAASDGNTPGSFGYLGINVDNPQVSGPAFEVSSSYAKFNNGLHIGDITTTGYSFPTTTGTQDQVLKVDANGDLVFGTDNAGLWTADANGITYAGHVGVDIASDASYSLSVGGDAKVVGTYSGGAIGLFPANGSSDDTIAIGDQDYLAAGATTTARGLSIAFDSTISTVDYKSGLIIGRNLNISRLKSDQLILGNRVTNTAVNQAPKIIIGNGIDYNAGNNNHAGAILIGANPACEMGNGLQIGGSGTNFNGVAIKATGAISSQGGVAIMGQASAYSVIIGASTYAGTSGSSSQKVVIGNGAGISSAAQVAIGAGAGSYKSGDYNTAIGQAAYSSNTSTGTGNTIIGKAAGQVLTSASNNTMIGARAALNMTNGSSNVVIGGGLGAGGGSPMQAMTSGTGNIVLGSNALVTATGASYNIVAGLDAGANVGGSNNLILGRRTAYAGTANNTAITDNVILGYEAGYNISSGYNVVIGSQAGNDLTTGAQNTFVGRSAGNDIITGNYNTTLGYGAGNAFDCSDTVVVGHNAGSGATGTGGEHVIIGKNAGSGAISGATVVIGSNSGTQAMGYGCVVIGRQAHNMASGGSTGQNNIMIGKRVMYNSSSALGSGNIIIGESGSLPAASNNNVYIRGNGTAGIVNIGGNVASSGGFTLGGTVESGGVALGQQSKSIVNGFSVGFQSGASQTTGADGNIFIGRETGEYVTTGTYNVFIGYTAGQNRIATNNDVAIGLNALKAASLSGENVAIGPYAGQNFDGGGSVLIGRSASGGSGLGGNARLVSIGYQANVTGIKGVAIGDSLAGASSVAIGSAHSPSANEVVIGPGTGGGRTAGYGHTTLIGYAAGLNSGTSTGIIIGGVNAATNSTFSGSIGIGGATLANATDTGSICIGNDSGKGSTSTRGIFIGYRSGQGVTGDYNVMLGESSGTTRSITGSVHIGYKAGAGVTQDYVTAIGYLAAEDTQASGLVAIGSSAARYLDTTAIASVAIGYEALHGPSALSKATGANNTAIGYRALKSTTSAQSNVAIGMNAGTAVTTGNQNVLIGGLAADGLTTGAQNVAVGSYAMGGATATGSYNVAIGEFSMRDITSGSNNIFIGKSSGLHATAGFIPSEVTATSSHQFLVQDGTYRPLIHGNLQANDQINGTGFVRMQNPQKTFYYGTGACSQNEMYYLSGAGTYAKASASAAGAAAEGFLLFTMGTDFGDGLIAWGEVDYTITGNAGDKVYLSTTSGALTTTAPSGSGNIVRVVGYVTYSNRVFLVPSTDYVEIA